MKKKTGGFMLVELLVALAVVALALVGLISLVSRSTSDAGLSRHKTEASAFAREGIEWVRNQRTSMGWAFVDGKKGSSYCINALSWIAGACSGTITGTTLYSRTATVAAKSPTTNPPKLVVTVTVSWTEASKNFTAVSATELTNY